MADKHILMKLAEVQAALKAPKSQYNSFGKYAYRSCEDILEAAKPLTVKAGATLTVSDEIVPVGNRIYVKATAKFSDPTGEVTNTAWAREPDAKKGMDESQITGMASSYARKYALNGLFCIDDTKDADTMDNRAAAPSSGESAKKTTVKDAIREANAAATYEQVWDVWCRYQEFGNDADFIAAVTSNPNYHE
jgi:hypothetical protein